MATSCMPSNLSGPQEKEGEPWLPPGFRFHPTDEELVSYYLTKKVINSSFSVRAIAEVDLNKCEPWDLPEKAKMGEKEWYFFSLRDRKYPTGMRTNRATDAGYWKATGKDRDVVSPRPPHLVGMKKTLVFYRGRAPKGEKTNWIMHEYRLEGDVGSQVHQPRSSKDEWVVCRIFQKCAGGKKNFVYTENGRMRNAMTYHFDDARSSLPALLDQSPNPTVTDEGNCTDCDTCAANDQVSCYNCHDLQETSNINHKENTAPLPWIVRTRSGVSVPGSGAMGTPGMDLLAGNVSNNKYPFFDVYDSGAKNVTTSRQRQEMGFPQAAVQSIMMSGKSFDLANFRSSLRPKSEPYSCDGEDEAQSSQRGLEYAWGEESVVYQEGNPMPLPSLTESSCISGSLGGEHPASLYRLNRYGLPDVAAPVDSLECLWAY